jgi:Protein of unknown function (DUF3618)
MTTTRPPTGTSETEALEADIERTRQHLAATVQELNRQLNVPRRLKESAAQARHRAVRAASGAGQRAKVNAGHLGHRAVAATGEARQRARRTTGELSHRALEATGEARQRARRTTGELSHRALEATAPARERARQSTGDLSHRTLEVSGSARQRARQLPELRRRHPRAAAAVSGAVAVGVGALIWITGRNR